MLNQFKTKKTTMKNAVDNTETISSEPSTSITLLIIQDCVSINSIASAVHIHNHIVAQLANNY